MSWTADPWFIPVRQVRSPNVMPNTELREDGNYELREDGSLELREQINPGAKLGSAETETNYPLSPLEGERTFRSGNDYATHPVRIMTPLFGHRVTLTSGTPVLNANVAGATTIYFTPFTSDRTTVWDGTSFIVMSAAELSLLLDSNVLAAQIYDLFVFLLPASGAAANTIAFGYGPAWSSNTVRSAAISRFNGIYTNSAQIVIRTSSTPTYTVPPRYATYVGSFIASGNGTVDFNMNPAAAAGGSGKIGGGLFNMHNRVPFILTERDSTASYTYNGATWRVSDGNANNIVTFLDGLGEVFVKASFQVYANGGGQPINMAISMNSTSATPTMAQAGFYRVTGGSGAVNGVHETYNYFLPAQGYNAFYPMELRNAGGVGATIWGSFGSVSTGNMQLQVEVTI
jgi:hypothetical protein